jgi:inosose dehydratase
MGRIRIGNAPCSWGVVKGVEGRESHSWLQVLDEMQTSGYAGTELGDWGFMPPDAAVVRRELEARGLSMLGAFTPESLGSFSCVSPAESELSIGPEPIALVAARLLAEVSAGSKEKPFIILADDPGERSNRLQKAGRITTRDSMSDAEWDAFISDAMWLATMICEDTGLRTVFHHHCGTSVETAAETARLLDSTPPDLIGLCLDTGHFAYAGDDPLEVLKRYRDRVWHVHFKDCDGPAVARAKAGEWDYITAIRNGIFCAIGEGSVDHAGFFAELEKGGYDGWIVVENEAPPGRMPPLQMARNDRAYLRSLGA